MLKSFDRSVSVPTTLLKVCDINPNRIALFITNLGGNFVTVHLGSDGNTSNGIRLNASGGALVIDRAGPWDGEIWMIADAAINPMGIVEVAVG